MQSVVSESLMQKKLRQNLQARFAAVTPEGERMKGEKQDVYMHEAKGKVQDKQQGRRK